MKEICRIFSRLLDYPTAEVKDLLAEVEDYLTHSDSLNEAQKKGLVAFLNYVNAFPQLRDWQEAYVQLFDTATNTNLYLFDFVFGTSRKRGQAMVDLKESYQKAGYQASDNELPDYLPLYLEFVSCSTDDDVAHKVLGEISEVLERMMRNFEKINHPYAALIKTIYELSK